MDNYVKSYLHPSKELALYSFSSPNFVLATYGDMKAIDATEYLEFLSLTGSFLNEGKTGRLLADFTLIKNFSTSLSAVAINNFRRLITDRAPYLLLALITSKDAFMDPAIRLALEVARPLSKKFVDGQIFKSRDEALEWLLDYPDPSRADKLF